MESFSIQLQPFFEWLLRTTVKASLLIGLILLVQVMLRGKLPIRWRYCLWLLLLVRLAAPWLPKSRISIFNLIPELLQPGRVGILSLIWLTGALVLAVYVFASDFNLWRIVKSESLVIEHDILELLEECKSQMGVRTIVGLVITDKVRSPALFGFVRPRLLLPKGMLEALGRQELRYVFLHELAHLKRHDIYLGWLMSLLQVLHWFNPLIWLAFYRMRANRELACDALVLAHTQSGRAKDYGRTIVSLLERFSRPQPLPSMAGILETKVQLKRRIKMIAKFKKTSRKRSVGAVLVLVALAYVTLTDAYSAPPFIFGTPTNLGPTVNRGPGLNSSDNDFSPNISADGLSLYFASARPGGSGGTDIYVATRETTDDDWSDPVNLGPTVNSSYNEGGRSISADGCTLYLYSDRPGGYGAMDLWVTTRASPNDPWETPVNLGATVNSSADEIGLSISADGLELYFSGWRSPYRPGGWGRADIWVTKRATVSDPWGTPVNLGWPVNSSSWDKGPSISSDGLTLFFGSYRSGYWDLWMTTRESVYHSWSTPVNLGPTVNSSAIDEFPDISADGLELYFHSNRTGGSGGSDLYVATRESVSEPFEQPLNLSGLDGGPSISANGLEFYLASWRPGGYGNIDLWVTTRETTEDDWETPVNLGPTVNSSDFDSAPRISADGLSLWFMSGRPGGSGKWDLWVTTRETTEDNWIAPVNLGPTVNSSDWDFGPSISADGLSLYFASDRISGYPNVDLWVTTRETTEDDWSAPVNLGPTINSSSYDCWPNISADGRVLFFDSDRAGGSGDWDLWMTTRETKDDDWGSPVNLGPAVNSSYRESTSSLSADGSTLYLASTRPGGLGGHDLWQVEVVVPQALPDFYADGKVNFKDFALLAYRWLDFLPFLDIAPAPFGDGIVDSRELAVLGEYWLKEPNLVAHWKLNETEGTIAHDSLGNNHSGRLLGGPLWRPAGGRIAGALELDGTDDYVSTPFVLDPSAGPFSAFAWIKGGEPNEVIISQTNGAGIGAAWLCTDPTDGKLVTWLMFPYPALESGFVITDGQWRHIGLVWDGSHRFLYVDGAEVAKDATGIFALLSDGGLYFGAGKTLDAGNFWTGLIDDVRIYDRALSEEDIAVLAD